MPESKSRFPVKTVVVLAIVVGILVSVFLFSRPVARVEAVQGGTAIKAVPGSVVVRAERDEELKTEVAGRILKSVMEEGRFVKEGEFLAQLDTGDLELEIEKISTELASVKRRVEVDRSDELALETAKGEYENATRMHKQGTLSDFDYQKQGRLLKQAEQKLEITKVNNKQLIDALDNNLRTKQRQLDKMTIRAPFDCVISKVYARENALVAGGSALGVLISTKRTVEAKISEENFSDITIGQKSRVRFLGYEGIFDATVQKLLPTADPETQRYLVHLDVAIEVERLIPGITGEVTIVIAERETKMLVPRRALFGHNVYVVQNGVVATRKVTLGYVSLTYVEILDGLQPGDQVIVEQIDRFHDGQRVRTELTK